MKNWSKIFLRTKKRGSQISPYGALFFVVVALKTVKNRAGFFSINWSVKGGGGGGKNIFYPPLEKVWMAHFEK